MAWCDYPTKNKNEARDPTKTRSEGFFPHVVITVFFFLLPLYCVFKFSYPTIVNNQQCSKARTHRVAEALRWRYGSSICDHLKCYYNKTNGRLYVKHRANGCVAHFPVRERP